MRRFHNSTRIVVLLAVLVIAAPAAFGLGGPDMGEGNLADVFNDGRTVVWRLTAPHSAVWLTVSTPCGVFHRQYDKGDDPKFSLEELAPDNPDGTYTWQIRIEPQIDPEIQEILAEARSKGDTETPKELWRAGKLPMGPFIQTGEWGVERGEILPPEQEKQGKLRVSAGAGADLGAATSGLERATAADIIHNDDVLILRSLCVGFDCVNGEVFGADTIRLKENNLRIHALDTSVGSFPTTDWRLEFNSNASGGASYFRVIDASAARNILTLEANAPSNSLVVDNGGRVGMGTANPVVELHVANGDTPTLRLEQTTASGFAAQTWDVAGNETSFFVRDATNGSTLPFRIRPGANNNSLVVDTDSDVGVGTLSPSASLHVRRSDGTALTLVEEVSGSVATRTLLRLTNNGGAGFALNNSNSGQEWRFDTGGADFNITLVGTGELAELDSSGNLSIDGDLTANGMNYPSSRAWKDVVTEVDSRQILERLVALPVTVWSYKDDAEGRRHIGTFSEDFHAAFDFLPDGLMLNTIDMHGVAMAAIQGLNQVVEEKDRQIVDLQDRLAKLEAAMSERTEQ